MNTRRCSFVVMGYLLGNSNLEAPPKKAGGWDTLSTTASRTATTTATAATAAAAAAATTCWATRATTLWTTGRGTGLQAGHSGDRLPQGSATSLRRFLEVLASLDVLRKALFFTELLEATEHLIDGLAVTRFDPDCHKFRYSGSRPCGKRSIRTDPGSGGKGLAFKIMRIQRLKLVIYEILGIGQ